MSVTGYLSDFSLPELFQFLQDGKKTGLLSIQVLSLPTQGSPTHYFIWLSQGKIVSVTSCLDGRCLADLLSRRGYLTPTVVERLIRRCPLHMSLGRFLHARGLLDNRQLKILFATQVIRQICRLFQVPDGYFRFDAKAPLPKVEMTGLSVAATEVVLPGLRMLKNWDGLSDKLPHPQSALGSLIRGQPHVRINRSEWGVWRLIDAKMTLQQVATHLHLSIEEVQRIAFRLIFVGLAEEIPMMLSEPVVDRSAPLLSSELSNRNRLSSGFLSHLVGVLRQVPRVS